MRVDVRNTAVGRWPGILASLGVAETFLSGKNGPCPACGGKDRFRFDDLEGRGTFFCSHCGAGDGFALLKNVCGLDFKAAAREVERVVGAAPVVKQRSERSEVEKVDAIKRLLRESKPVMRGDPVWKYLDRRIGIESVSPDLRFHPAISHRSGGKNPAMLAVLRDVAGNGVSLHRTYLTQAGEKAAVDPVRMLMPGKPIIGASIRLGAVSEELGVAEGIETALAAAKRFGMPVWSAVNAGLLEQWLPPSGVERVVVFGDNDRNFVGQSAAYSLAKRLSAQGCAVEVRISEPVGSDWADVSF